MKTRVNCCAALGGTVLALSAIWSMYYSHTCHAGESFYDSLVLHCKDLDIPLDIFGCRQILDPISLAAACSPEALQDAMFRLVSTLSHSLPSFKNNAWLATATVGFFGGLGILGGAYRDIKSTFKCKSEAKSAPAERSEDIELGAARMAGEYKRLS